MPRYKFDKSHSDYFGNVDYIVEADSYAQHSLWRNHATASKEFGSPCLDGPFVDWIQENVGYLLQIGKVDDRPIAISVNYARINNKRIMFYYASSQLIDYVMVESWLKKFGKNIETCDANNFYRCLDFSGAYKSENKKDDPKETYSL